MLFPTFFSTTYKALAVTMTNSSGKIMDVIVGHSYSVAGHDNPVFVVGLNCYRASQKYVLTHASFTLNFEKIKQFYSGFLAISLSSRLTMMNLTLFARIILLQQDFWRSWTLNTPIYGRI